MSHPHGPVVTSITLLSLCWRTRSPTPASAATILERPGPSPFPSPACLHPLLPCAGPRTWAVAARGRPPRPRARPLASLLRPTTFCRRPRRRRRPWRTTNCPRHPLTLTTRPQTSCLPRRRRLRGIWGSLCRRRRHPHPPSPRNPWGRPRWPSKGRRLRLRGRKTQDHRAGEGGSKISCRISWKLCRRREATCPKGKLRNTFGWWALTLLTWNAFLLLWFHDFILDTVFRLEMQIETSPYFSSTLVILNLHRIETVWVNVSIFSVYFHFDRFLFSLPSFCYYVPNHQINKSLKWFIWKWYF